LNEKKDSDTGYRAKKKTQSQGLHSLIPPPGATFPTPAIRRQGRRARKKKKTETKSSARGKSGTKLGASKTGKRQTMEVVKRAVRFTRQCRGRGTAKKLNRTTAKQKQETRGGRAKKTKKLLQNYRGFMSEHQTKNKQKKKQKNTPGVLNQTAARVKRGGRRYSFRGVNKRAAGCSSCHHLGGCTGKQNKGHHLLDELYAYYRFLKERGGNRSIKHGLPTKLTQTLTPHWPIGKAWRAQEWVTMLGAKWTRRRKHGNRNSSPTLGKRTTKKQPKPRLRNTKKDPGECVPDK